MLDRRAKSEDDPELRIWLSSRVDYTSPKVQNEILSLLSHSVVREILDNIRSLFCDYGWNIRRVRKGAGGSSCEIR